MDHINTSKVDGKKKKSHPQQKLIPTQVGLLEKSTHKYQ